MNEFIHGLSSEHPSAMRCIVFIGLALCLAALMAGLEKTSKAVGESPDLKSAAAGRVVAQAVQSPAKRPEPAKAAAPEMSFQHVKKAGEYLASGDCPDRAALVRELDGATALWAQRKNAKKGVDFDAQMREQQAPRPDDLLAASVFLADKAGYDFAMNLIGDIERDAYYHQKWDLGVSQEDLGEMHSAFEGPPGPELAFLESAGGVPGKDTAGIGTDRSSDGGGAAEIGPEEIRLVGKRAVNQRPARSAGRSLGSRADHVRLRSLRNNDERSLSAIINANGFPILPFLLRNSSTAFLLRASQAR